MSYSFNGAAERPRQEAETMTTREQELTAALRNIEALLADWPTMRALSALGAERATANKNEAKAIIAAALKSA
jgi:hypothetical protein